MQRFRDNILIMGSNGLIPYSGSSVAVYLAGTSTLASIYPNNDPAGAKENPFRAGDYGEIDFYAQNGRYDLLLTRQGYQSLRITDLQIWDPANSDFVTSVDVDGMIAGKADKTYVDSELLGKADITYVDQEVAGLIDDVTPASDKAYSSQKVSTDLAAKVSSADLADDTDPAKGAAIGARAAVSVGTISDLATAPRDRRLTAVVTSYSGGWAATSEGPTGGGEFYWDDLCTQDDDGGITIAVPGVTVGRWRRLYNGAVNVRWFGAKGNGASDDTLAFQRAIAFAKKGTGNLGTAVYAPSGSYVITGSLDFRRSAGDARRINFYGDGESHTRLLFQAAGTCIYMGGPDDANSLSHQEFSNFCVLGSGAVPGTQVGLDMNLVPMFTMRNVRIEGMDDGIVGYDVDHTKFYNVSVRFNVRGASFRKNPVTQPKSTHPNNNAWIGGIISSNTEYGVWLRGSALFTFYSCSVENNGTAPTGYGIKYENPGWEGGVGASCYAVYFESNRGAADLLIQATATIQPGFDEPLNACTHNVVGCSFARGRDDAFAINNIVAQFGDPAQSGKQVLNLSGTAFKSAGSYEPSASRKYVAFTSIAPTDDNFVVTGCMFEDEIETPGYQKPNKSYILASKSSTQAIPSGTYTKWELDSVSGRFGFTTASLDANDVVIRETGVYLVSANIQFSSVEVTGGLIRLFRGAVPIATQSMGGATAGSISVAKQLTAGDRISISVMHESGADRTLTGTATSSVGLSITKLADNVI